MRIARLLQCLVIVACLACWTSRLQAADDAWNDFRYLVGEWVGEGGGQPGQGGGSFSINFELQERIMVRRNKAEFPASQGRPGQLEPGRPVRLS